MSGSSGNAKEIDLGTGVGDVAVKANGIRVEMHADGRVVAYTKSDVDAYTNGAVHVHPASDSWTIRDKDKIVGEGRVVEVIGGEPKPGDRMPDGSIYAGESPDTLKPMYAMPVDEPLAYTFKKAALQANANNLTNALGHHDWRVPTKRELNVLWENRNEGALKGTFNVTGSSPAGWYWSSSQDGNDHAWAQRFSDGHQRSSGFKYNDSSLRCVR